MVRRQTILVIDDEPDVVRSVQDLLRLDYRVLGTTRAEEGAKILQEQEVDIIMTDQRMPGITGVEFLRRARGEHPETIRLLFTGYADIKAVVDAINQGNVFRYITKPWDAEELQAVIRQAAEQRRLLVERKELLAELKSKNQALEQANVELKQASELKEAFIRVASHELRTPLTILYGLTELALRSPGLSGPLQDWLHSIHKASLRLNRLADQLIKMMLAHRFDRALERQATDLAELLQKAVEDVQAFVEQRRQKLIRDLAPNLGTLALDADKIRDSIENLLLNAIKFTPDGGQIQVTARRTPTGGAEIRVRDTGAGIDAASLPHVFDPFFTEFDVTRHSSGTFEYRGRGLGLGLTLVKVFVELHGGTVAAASVPGQGSTFTITLPHGEA